jgi:hypothetical protein
LLYFLTSCARSFSAESVQWRLVTDTALSIYLSETDPIKPELDAIVGQSSLLELSSVIWPTTVADSTSLPKIELHLATKNAKLSDFFSQLCEAIKLARQQCLARLGNVMHRPGSQEAVYLDVVWLQLTEDMFVSGFPSIDETCSARKLRAYQAFGVLLGSLVVNNGSLPLQIDDDVLKFAFGLRKDCVEDIRQQMDAIRTGVFKVEIARR